MPKISIIIRTRNEEQWIGHCLSMVCKQDIQDFEIILVDNDSSDHTVEVAKRFPLEKIITIEKFRPGQALNQGIRGSKGDYIVSLSAHCVPKGIDWLSKLYCNFEKEPMVACVYGRQLPVSFTDSVDKRDLLIVFGQDRRVQVKDYFFHNANSMTRRDEAVIEAGYRIVYEPEAPVYHHHGLHQGNNLDRAKGVVSIIEKVDKKIVNDLPDSLKPENTNIAAVIPILGNLEFGSLNRRLCTNTLNSFNKSKYVDTVYVVSLKSDLASHNSIWIDRSQIPDVDELSLDELMQKVLHYIESEGDFPASLLYVNYDYLYRSEGLFDELIFEAQYKGYDTVFPGYIDYAHYWFRTEDEQFHQTDPSLKTRAKRNPVFRALYGLGCLTSTAHIRQGKMVGGKVGIFPIDELKYTLRIKNLSNDILDKFLV